MAAATDDASNYLVVKTTYPTTYGCNRGLSWSRADLISRSNTEVVGTYPSFAQAVEAARQARDSSEWFTDYEIEHETEDDLPPFDSAIMENYDNDDEVLIRVLREPEFRQEQADDEEFLQNHLAEEQLEAILKKEVVRIQVEESGNVFYSSGYSDFQVPAELEIDESKDTEKHQITQIPANGAASLKSLLFKVSSKSMSHQAIMGYNEERHESCELIQLLQQCTELEELYLRCPFETEMCIEFVEALSKKAPHLSNSIKVYSMSGIELEPEALSKIGDVFPKLVRLDISDCFSTEHWQEPDDFDYGSSSNLPYDKPFLECLQKLTCIQRIDLGNGDAEMRRYLYDYSLSRGAVQHAKEMIRNRFGSRARITMDEDNLPEPFADPSKEKAAKQQALMGISENMDGKYPEPVVSLAKEKLMAQSSASPRKRKA